MKEYKVIPIYHPSVHLGQTLEKRLNRLAEKGWYFVAEVCGDIVMEREKEDV